MSMRQLEPTTTTAAQPITDRDLSQAMKVLVYVFTMVLIAYLAFHEAIDSSTFGYVAIAAAGFLYLNGPFSIAAAGFSFSAQAKLAEWKVKSGG